MFKKIFSIVSFDRFLFLPNLNAVILPLLQKPSVDFSRCSLLDACDKIKYFTNLYINPDQCDGVSSNDLLRDVDTYFNSVMDGTLYSDFNQDDIYSLLIQISHGLPSKDDGALSSSSRFLLDHFLSTIQDRHCFDQHRSALRHVVFSPFKDYFDPAIYRVVELILGRMQTQIDQTLKLWDYSVFNGYLEKDPVHYHHIVYLLLDDLFGTAGGSFKSEKDIVLSKTTLGKLICYETFKNSLTVGALLRGNDTSWQTNLALMLSFCEDNVFSSIKLSIHDLLRSTKFLSFLEETGHLNSSQKHALFELNNPLIVDTASLSLPWLFYTDDIDCPQIRYNEFFSELLITFIYQTLCSLQNVSFVKSSPSIDYESELILPEDLLIIDKFINQYFLKVDSIQPFTYDDIKCAVNADFFNTLYTTPFLKSTLQFKSVMIANCDLKDISRIFYDFLLPNLHQPWVFDTILMRLLSNPSSLISISCKDWISVQNAHGESLLFCLSKFYPDTVLLLLEFCPDFLSICTSVRKMNSIFHNLAYYHPDIFIQIFKIKPELFASLKSVKNQDSFTPVHFLASHHPRILIDFIQDNPGYLPDFVFHRTTDGDTPIHSLSQNFPSYFVELLRAFPHSFPILSKFQQSDGNTPFHYLAMYHSEIFCQLIQDLSFVSNFVLTLSDNVGNTPIHLLSKVSKDSFVTLIKSGFFSLSQLSFLKNQSGATPLDYLNYSLLDELTKFSGRRLRFKIFTSFKWYQFKQKIKST